MFNNIYIYYSIDTQNYKYIYILYLNQESGETNHLQHPSVHLDPSHQPLDETPPSQ